MSENEIQNEILTFLKKVMPKNNIEQIAKSSNKWCVYYFTVDWSWSEYDRFTSLQSKIKIELQRQIGKPVFVQSYKKLVKDLINGQVIYYNLKIGYLIK